MARRVRFKPRLRDTMRQAHSAMAFMAMAAPIEKAAAADAFIATVVAAIPPAPKKRATGVDIDRIHRRNESPLESEVVTAISQLLARHPKVLFACRQNSGAASYEAASGKYAPVVFYRILTHGREMTITDFWGILKDGRPFAIEAKREGFIKPRNDREYAQANFLMMIRNAGGIGIFATNSQTVADALK